MNSRETHQLQEFERMHGALAAVADREFWSGRFERLRIWLLAAKEQCPEVADWIGVYIKESSIFSGKGTDLLLGPYLGDETEHVRISIDKGICGLALREERVVNVRDVRVDARHIACSLKTRSELVIPLQDIVGAYVAELDIDCNKLDAFTPEIEARFRDYAATFRQAWD